ncbi:hypothetical protein M0Q50_01200 [bacterium]|jgi:hypothetical protein|nr:hypothetical protein [bacterium]
MKKFTSQTDRNISIKIIPTKMDETLSKIMDETLSTKMISEEITTEQISLEGKQEFINRILELTNDEIEKSNDSIKIQLEKNSTNVVNIKNINTILENIQKTYSEIVPIPSPKDIFSDEDYKVFGDEIVIESLNNIPSVYEQYLNIDSVANYFEQGNIIKTRYIGANEGWKLEFNGNLSEYATSVSTEDEKFEKFVDANKDFISSIYEATNSLIGDKIIIKQHYVNKILGLK